MDPIVLVLLVGAQLAAAGATAQPSWPDVTIPDGVRTFEIGTQLTDNGVPMRLQGFTSVKSPYEVAELFRQRLGKPLADDTVGGKVVLGRALGERYLTIQVEPAGAGTRGVIAVASLGEAIRHRDATRSEEERLLARLPAGTRVISRTGSIDGNATAEHLVLSNGHSPSLNAGYVKSLLGEDGFTYEREGAGGNDGRPAAWRDGTTLFFRGAAGEAMAVIFRADGGGTTVVLNTIRHPGLAK